MTPTYSSAVDWCWSTRWAECKDRDRSRARALACLPEETPTAEAFAVHTAFALRNRLKNLGLSPATVNRHLAAYLAVWGAYLQSHEREEDLAAPPSGLYLREPAGRSRVVTEDEAARVWAELDWAGYGDLARFLYETGCRVSEALKLHRADLDLRARTVTFRGTKNGDNRTVPLTSRAVDALVPMSAADPFAGCSQAQFNHAWSNARRRMGLESDPGFVPHALRHTAVTRWVAAGLPLPVVAKLAGHRSIKTTLRYTHLSTADLTAAMSRAGIL